jgi:dGTPase
VSWDPSYEWPYTFDIVNLQPTVRELIEEREAVWLSGQARLSRDAVRPRREPKSDLRTEFQRDRDRILHTKSFRRLKHKTQVFIGPAGDHYRTRLTHTLEVTQIARTIGRALRLNEDLIEAIGIGHDLGHAPFGHAGESALCDFLPGFRHDEQSLRVVDVLENDGLGLNLTDDVRDGIRAHSKPDHELSEAYWHRAESHEGEVVRLSDAVAYINHDLDDAMRAGMLDGDDLPAVVTELLGSTHAERIDTLIHDIVANSEIEKSPAIIQMSDEILAAANALRAYLFERVYAPLNRMHNTRKAQDVVLSLCRYYVHHLEEMPLEYRMRGSDLPERVVVDYVASMTDRYAIDRFAELYVPQYWSA